MLKALPEIDKYFILDRVSQEEIFERYVGGCVLLGEKYLSPLREDNRPTCTYRYLSSGSLRFRDWNGSFEGDCFNLVQRLFSCSFFEACEIIARDFKLVDGLKKGKNYDRKPKVFSQTVLDRAHIQVKWRPLEKTDILYWNRFNITPDVLNKFKVAPVQFVWLNGGLIYQYRKEDPAYAYWFGPNDIKVYFPLRKDSVKFMGNTSKLQGYDQLPKTGDTLIVTKSMKDVMTLFSNRNIPSVAPQSEATIITPEQFQDLSGRFSNIISLYDFDLTGVRGANKMRKLYGIKAEFLTDGRFGTKDYGAKDFSELVENERNKQ